MAKDFIGEQGVVITAGRTFDFTDETGAGADDGTGITKEKVMQLMAVFQHLMVAAGYTHNGLVENAVTQTPGDTQYYDALVARMVAEIAAKSDVLANINIIAKRGANAEIYAQTGYPTGLNLVNTDYLNSTGVPIGVPLPFCSATLPAGWLECNGAAISRTTYPLLFAAIGTTWGAGDGSTTFTLPDFRNRLLAGEYPSSPSGSRFNLPSSSGVLIDNVAGQYQTLSAGSNRFIAGVKFMIRAL